MSEVQTPGIGQGFGEAFTEIERELARADAARDRILELCSRVPPSVLNGDHQTACAWKELAIKAYQKALRSPLPKAETLEGYVADLEQYA